MDLHFPSCKNLHFERVVKYVGSLLTALGLPVRASGYMAKGKCILFINYHKLMYVDVTSCLTGEFHTVRS